MRATILPKAHKAADSTMAKECTASVVFLFFYFPIIQIIWHSFLYALCSDDPEVFLPEYFQTAILHAVTFRRVVDGP